MSLLVVYTILCSYYVLDMYLATKIISKLDAAVILHAVKMNVQTHFRDIWLVINEHSHQHYMQIAM